jgi:hypothetical protein
MSDNNRPYFNIPLGDEDGADEEVPLRVPQFDIETAATPKANQGVPHAPTGPRDGINLRPAMSGYRGFGKKLYWIVAGLGAIIIFGFLYGTGAFKPPGKQNIASEVIASPSPSVTRLSLDHASNALPVAAAPIRQGRPPGSVGQTTPIGGAPAQVATPSPAMIGQELQTGSQIGASTIPVVPDPNYSIPPANYQLPNASANAIGTAIAQGVGVPAQSSSMVVTGTTGGGVPGASGLIDQGGSGSLASGSAQSGDDAGADAGPTYAVWAGDEVSAVLDTKIVSDLPGVVVAHVAPPGIYDSRTGQHLLVPPFTRIIGESGSATASAQTRLGIPWSLMIEPNGCSIDLNGLQASDTQGASGVPATHVDTHKAAIVRETFIQSLAQAVGSRIASLGSNGQVVVNTGQAMLPADPNNVPTLTIAPTTPFTIIFDRQIDLHAYNPSLCQTPVVSP